MPLPQIQKEFVLLIALDLVKNIPLGQNCMVMEPEMEVLQVIWD